MGIRPAGWMNVGSGAGGVSAETAPHLNNIAGTTRSGGSDWYGPADPYVTSYAYYTDRVFPARTVDFTAFFVPKPLLLLGGFATLTTISTTSGAVVRAGVFRLGAPNGDGWDIGDLVADFGAQSATVVGHKMFDLPNQVLLEPGWYATALGVNGANAKFVFGRWMTPGTHRIYPYVSGAQSRARIDGAAYTLRIRNVGRYIANGFNTLVQDKNPAECLTSTSGFSIPSLFPKWRVPA